MGTVNNANQGKQDLGGQQRHDGQQNYQHSNQINPDNVRSDTGKHKYAEHDQETNDQNFNADSQTDLSPGMDFRDKNDNLKDSGN